MNIEEQKQNIKDQFAAIIEEVDKPEALLNKVKLFGKVALLQAECEEFKENGGELPEDIFECLNTPDKREMGVAAIILLICASLQG